MVNYIFTVYCILDMEIKFLSHICLHIFWTIFVVVLQSLFFLQYFKFLFLMRWCFLIFWGGNVIDGFCKRTLMLLLSAAHSSHVWLNSIRVGSLLIMVRPAAMLILPFLRLQHGEAQLHSERPTAMQVVHSLLPASLFPWQAEEPSLANFTERD